MGKDGIGQATYSTLSTVEGGGGGRISKIWKRAREEGRWNLGTVKCHPQRYFRQELWPSSSYDCEYLLRHFA